MLVDNPLQPNYSLNAAFEDFFNFDLLAGPSNSQASGESSPDSDSPSDTSSTILSTPPDVFPPVEVVTDSNGFFSFNVEDAMTTKGDQPALPSPTGTPLDLFSAFSGSSAASGSSSYVPSTESSVGIDPQLVGTPSNSNTQSEFDEDEEHADGGDEDDDQMDDFDNDLEISPVKVGGRGKAAGRKGTVQSGGIVKKSGGGDKKENKPAGMLSTTSTEADDWRPSPEEYKKMSSKEKRQLRNKISARNFRVRRKEYISTLEGDIAERDRLIDAIRTELGSTKSENNALRQEISALKKALLDGRGRADTPVLPPPAPLPTISPATLAASNVSAPVPKSPLLTANTHKDLPTSPRLGARGFWGGASSFGGITPVHTTLVPEWGSVLSGKPVVGATGRRSPTLQENINPILNGVTASSIAALYAAQGKQENKEGLPMQQVPFTAFDTFADVNPFTMKSLDAYRMQLWSKMAQQQAIHNKQTGQTFSNNPTAPAGLAANIRPHYFTGKASPTLSAILSGKGGSEPEPVQTMPTPQQAMLASAASHTLLSKIGSAFWDAFARPAGTLGPNGRTTATREWDAEKVRKVMEGTAVVRVVDIEPPVQAQQQQQQQAASMRSSSTLCGVFPTPGRATMTDKLEESMSKLTLCKK